MEFIQKYSKVYDDSDNEFIDDGVTVEEERVSDCELIENSTEFDDQGPENYYLIFRNVKKNPEEAAQDQGLAVLDEIDDEPEKYSYEYEVDKNEIDYDIFTNFEKRIEKFKNELTTFEKNSKDLFYNAVLYALIFKLTKRSEFITDENEIMTIIGNRYIWFFKKFKKQFCSWSFTTVFWMSVFQFKWVVDGEKFFTLRLRTSKEIQIYYEKRSR